MKVRRIQDLAGFRDLSSIWGEVARESGQTSPFLSHDWFECCWIASPPPRRPEVLVVEDAAGPVALVPIVGWTGPLRGLPVRYLGMLDSPDTAFVDWLVVGSPDAAVRAVLDHLAGRRDWDTLSLSGLPAGSATLKAISAQVAERFRVQRLPSIPSPYVAVSGSWDEFWASTSQRFKKTLRGVRNRLEKAGRVTIEEHREAGPDSAAFQALVDVSRRSWKAPRALAIATMPGMAEFFARLTERASAQGWLRLWLLSLDGRPVASEYQLEWDGRVYALRADVDDRVPEDLSPGSHLSGEIVRALFGRAGVHEYNMGPGDNPYKSRWATGAQETARLRVFRPGVYGASLHALESRVVPALRRLRGGEPWS